MKKAIPFEAVRRLLTDLGFTENQTQKGHYSFRNERGDLFLFRPYPPTDPVSGADLISLRYHLDAWGLLEQDGFEDWLHDVAV